MTAIVNITRHWQPPPRGCVLKLFFFNFLNNQLNAAASARLCVETKKDKGIIMISSQPPPRGCVLKLCVNVCGINKRSCSRLRAAVC